MGAIILKWIEHVHFTWLLFLLFALRKEHKVKSMQLTAFQNCLQSWIKTSFLRPKDELKICPFPVLRLPFIHIFVTHLCYDSALVSGNGCKVKVNKLGTQGRSPCIKLSPWKWRWHGEHSPQWIVVHQQYAVCWCQETSGCCNQPQELYHSNGQSQGIIWA